MKKKRIYAKGYTMPVRVKQLLLIMKMTFIFLLLFCLQLRAETHAQTVTLSVNNRPLKEVLEMVKKQTDYMVILTSDVEESANPVTIEVKNMPLSAFMSTVMANQPAFYYIKEKTIFIARRKNVPQNKPPLQSIVRGKVTDSDGYPVPRASVKLKDTRTATATDVNGNFSIQASPGQVLIFSSLGFSTVERRIDNNAILNVVLKIDVTNLSEVVVVVGYGVVKKSDLTGSISSVKIGDNNENKVVSVPEALLGRVSGVNILNNTGEPGSGMTFNIRGLTSITGNNQPLIVLDGQPIESGLGVTSAGINVDWQSQTPPLDPLASLNPSDIGSIEILKDASSTAIYGSRGANGVVLITTKTGKSNGNKDRFTYNLRTDLSNLPHKIEMADALTFMRYRNEAAMNNGLGPAYTEEQMTANAEQYGGHNWQDLVYRTAKSQEHQLTASGLIGKSNYRVSLDYGDNQSILNNAGFKKGGLRFNFNRDITKKLSLAIRSNLSLTERTYGAQSNTQGVFASSAVIGAIASTPLRMAYTDDGDLDLTFANNPVLVTELLRDVTDTRMVIAGIDLDYKIIKGLSYKLKGAVNEVSSLRQLYWPRGTFQGDEYEGSATRADNLNGNYMIDHLLNYNGNFKKHRVNAVAGYSYQYWYRKGTSITSTGFPSDDLGYENFALADKQGTYFTTNKNRALQSVLGRVTYSYDSKYLLTLTGRSDGATRLAPGNKWHFFPSVGLGWNVASEKFFKKAIPAVNNLKLRASYGIAGSENVAIGATQADYSIDYVTIGDRILPGLNYNSFPNHLLTWETTASVNAGFDLGIFNDRITFTADFYSKKTTDLLIGLSIPASSTFRSYSTNTGEVTNKGLDLETSVQVMRTKNLDWSMFGNASFNRNKVISMGGTNMIYGGIYLNGGNNFLGQALQVAKVGEQISSFWAYKSAGVYQNPLEILNDPNIANDPAKSTYRPGDVRFKDINGDGKIDENDKTIVGKPNPDFSIGFGSNVSYKRWNFAFTFIGSFGNELINLNQWLIGSLTNLGTYNVSMDAWNNRWRGEGTSNKYPRANRDAARFGNRFPDYMIEDASFVRLQNVNVGYTFKMDRIAKGSTIKTYVSGTNLFTITNYSGYDPSINSQGHFALMSGVDYGTLPQARTFSLGLILSY
ncbi:TonB-linked SusC/RagA family outer membrane protein [Arcticibacter tournemirensis]|uniref:SusC/RagA family TonB-linked outer membrane protein n=1 Tax=Arcticibacter tournemirensis TaxID=699437 RepID=UPI00114D5AD1|nr:TonB-dependent receptor [Arcticibacter tournemirensis]TQM51630.1 TonB-linked SusC/RagA family outer membrane protein [Arcticibacter tournemirensis]